MRKIANNHKGEIEVAMFVTKRSNELLVKRHEYI